MRLWSAGACAGHDLPGVGLIGGWGSLSDMAMLQQRSADAEDLQARLPCPASPQSSPLTSPCCLRAPRLRAHLADCSSNPCNPEQVGIWGGGGTYARHAAQMGQARLLEQGFSFDALGGQAGLQGDTDMTDAPPHLDLPKAYFGGAPGPGSNSRHGLPMPARFLPWQHAHVC